MHRHTNKCHSPKQTLSVSIRGSGRRPEEFSSLRTKRGRRRVSRLREGGREEDRRRMGNGKDGGEGAAERIHYIICVPLFCLSSYGRLISLTLMQPQLSRAPVELWVMKPAFTNREINTWLPGNGNKLSPSVSLSLLRTHSHFLCPPPFVTLYLPHALTFLHPLFSPSSSSSSPPSLSVSAGSLNSPDFQFTF